MLVGAIVLISTFVLFGGVVLSLGSSAKGKIEAKPLVGCFSALIKPTDMGAIRLLEGDPLTMPADAEGASSIIVADSSIVADANGAISAVGGGETTVGALFPDGRLLHWQVTCEMRIPMVIPIDRQAQLESEYSLSGWTSSDAAVATVDETGAITGTAVGDCRVTAQDQNGLSHGWNISVRKAAYLTFDDWPNASTGSILNTLKDYNAKATFFVTQQARNMEYYQMIIDDGHAIGNHSFSHNLATMYTTKETACANFKLQDKWLWDNFNIKTSLLRFPGGTNSDRGGRVSLEAYRMLKKDGRRIFDWTSCLGDAESTDPEVCLARLKRETKDNAEIILMHNKKMTAELLPDIMDYLEESGYAFFALDESCPTYSFFDGWED